LKLEKFLNKYIEDGYLGTICSFLGKDQNKVFQLKGLSGSLDSVVAASIYLITGKSQLFILPEREEAAYFHNDLQNLFPDQEILLFPMSYKRPYEFETTENANILRRAEILNRINQKGSSGEIIVSYPEALCEKVINKISLSRNTFSAHVGEEIDLEFLNELLHTYGFERSEFVYEAGQFAIRGGIVDIFSFANDLPFRLELFGDEIDNIRTFNPESQLSIDPVEEISIIPNVQTKLLEEKRQSFLEFIPPNTKVWIKDYQHSLDVIDKVFRKSAEEFHKILAGSGNTRVILKPEDLFDNGLVYEKLISKFCRIEFGNIFYLEPEHEFTFEAEPQPSFNKNFELLAENLEKLQHQSYSLFFASESENQLERLKRIFDEINPEVHVVGIPISFREGFVDRQNKVACYTDHQLFERFHRYKQKEKFSKTKALTFREIQNLQPGDFVTHIDYGIGKFAGLEKVEVNGKEQEMLRLIYRDDDLLFVSIHSLHKISKYSGKEGQPPSISKLGSQEWENKKRKIKKKVQDIAKDLINLYAKRRATHGHAFEQDGYLQAELESSFIYEDTPDQAKATEDVKKDMEQLHPMDRLVCGDVGFGKTEVAIRAAFKAVNDGKQVAILVPTTILALQHYHTFSERLENFPIKIEYINRFKSAKETKEIIEQLKTGAIDIIIGTHKIVSKEVKFKDLGLLVIDEEQKFGVKVKEKLKEIKINVDTLTLTATPIPRTLHFSLMGARDLSIISTAPPNRQPVTTEIHVFNESTIRDAISYELQRGGQVFFVHNRIGDIEQIANIILRLVPEARIGIAHGQMEGKKLESVMEKFIEQDYDVLVSTNIIESGLDIPNANTIIINHAHMFGLSDLHQMRGRVGRSNKKAFCILLSPPTIHLSSDARKRLKALEEFSELGDGFKVAMRDLDIRGAGNLLGAEQSGFISDLGFDMYHKILDDAIQELKETEFGELFSQDLSKHAALIHAQDCVIETDLEILIPENYINNITERLRLYTELDNTKDENGLTGFITAITDRFGPYPEPVKGLISSVRLRWIAEFLGFEKIMMKNGSFKGYFAFTENKNYFNSDVFGKILQYVQAHPKRCQLKEINQKLILTIGEINSVEDALESLKAMQ
jgi:transcription-repair coupling factor (superfamily II helicase)